MFEVNEKKRDGGKKGRREEEGEDQVGVLICITKQSLCIGKKNSEDKFLTQ